MVEEKPLPPSLAVVPNIPYEKQTLDQLEAERAYWEEKVQTASGPASAMFAEGFRKRCERWIELRKEEALVQ